MMDKFVKRKKKVPKADKDLMQRVSLIVTACRLQQEEFNKGITGRTGYMLLEKEDLPEYIKDKIEFCTHPDGRTPGTFTNFDSLDDHIDQVYYHMQFIKFGFGRASRDGSRHLQNGSINKNEFLENIIKYDHEINNRDILYFCEYIGISTIEFTEILDKHRNEEIWKKTSNGWDLNFKMNKKIINEN